MSITGVVFYDGASRIDGSPIVGIATFGTKNTKTGNLVQTWILRSDMHPGSAINTGDDVSICGTCPLRGIIRPAAERSDKRSVQFGDTTNKGRSCYVLVQNAPTQIYHGYQRGIYPILDQSHRKYMMGKGLRFGAYGDPVAIPIRFWNSLAKFCTGKSAPGYTHQWKDARFQAWKRKVMASTHTLAENELASSMGWRTFRTIADLTAKTAGEIVCPASAEGGYKANCEMCGACDGRRDMSDGRKSVVILAHGSGGKVAKVEQIIASAV